MTPDVGMSVTVRYYGAATDAIKIYNGRIIGLDQIGVVVSNGSQVQMFPWTSVQRLILSEPTD